MSAQRNLSNRKQTCKPVKSTIIWASPTYLSTPIQNFYCERVATCDVLDGCAPHGSIVKAVRCSGGSAVAAGRGARLHSQCGRFPPHTRTHPLESYSLTPYYTAAVGNSSSPMTRAETSAVPCLQ